MNILQIIYFFPPVAVVCVCVVRVRLILDSVLYNTVVLVVVASDSTIAIHVIFYSMFIMCAAKL